MPIRLMFGPQSSTAAVENVLLHGNKIASLSVHNDANRMPLMCRLFTSSRPSVERLHIYSKRVTGWRIQGQTAHEIWRDFPLLRELFVCRYTIPIHRFTAPNLIHLALEHTGYRQNIMVQSVLDMLRNCPLLETLLIADSGIRQDPTGRDHSPVPLPHLRSIKLSADEVRSGLETYLQFPRHVAAGFRMLSMIDPDARGDAPLTAIVAIRHMLRRIDIHYITLAVPSDPRCPLELLIRFEGLQGSLETTVYCVDHPRLLDFLFGSGGVLSSLSQRIENVKELHIVGCSFDDDQELEHISTAMPNLASISFFDCEGPHVFGLLIPTDPLSPPFPHLERVMVLGSELGLGGMAETRRNCGVPLKTVVIGRGPSRSEYGHQEDYVALGEFVGDLRVGCPTEIVEWGTENEILNTWSTIKVPGPVSLKNKGLIVLG